MVSEVFISYHETEGNLGLQGRQQDGHLMKKNRSLIQYMLLLDIMKVERKH